MPRKPKLLEVQISDARWRKIPRLHNRLETAAAETLALLPKNLRLPCSMTLLLGTDAAIRRLNRDFRGLDKATNVLSFPQYDGLKSLRAAAGGLPIYVGDIAIAYQYMVSESKRDNKILINHLTHLLIHGILHLFGYDHMHELEATRMEGLERRIMKRLGLPDPYAAPPDTRNTSRTTQRPRRTQKNKRPT